MSRLDDELKIMFQRQQPSDDFAERVLARIAAEQKPKASFWQTLVEFFQLPLMRWALAATAVLLIGVVGFVQYQKLHQNKADNQIANAAPTKAGDNMAQSGAIPTPQKEAETATPASQKTAVGIKADNKQTVSHKNLQPRHLQKLNYVKESAAQNETTTAISTPHQSESEIAKEQLMRALFIASATVNEAKKLAIGTD
jgi:hypothetical protein